MQNKHCFKALLLTQVFQLQGESLVLYDFPHTSGDFKIQNVGTLILIINGNQGGGEAPKNLSGRLVAATWYLSSIKVFSLILYVKIEV